MTDTAGPDSDAHLAHRTYRDFPVDHGEYTRRGDLDGLVSVRHVFHQRKSRSITK